MSQLILHSVKLSDSGNYSCQPASLNKAVITLHVIKDTSQQLVVLANDSEMIFLSVTTGILMLTVQEYLLWDSLKVSEFNTVTIVVMYTLKDLNEQPNVLENGKNWALGGNCDLTCTICQ